MSDHTPITPPPPPHVRKKSLQKRIDMIVRWWPIAVAVPLFAAIGFIVDGNHMLEMWHEHQEAKILAAPHLKISNYNGGAEVSPTTQLVEGQTLKLEIAPPEGTQDCDTFFLALTGDGTVHVYPREEFEKDQASLWNVDPPQSQTFFAISAKKGVMNKAKVDDIKNDLEALSKAQKPAALPERQLDWTARGNEKAHFAWLLGGESKGPASPEMIAREKAAEQWAAKVGDVMNKYKSEDVAIAGRTIGVRPAVAKAPAAADATPASAKGTP